MSKAKCYLLAAISGLFFVLAFPPVGLNLLAFVLLIPLISALENAVKVGASRWRLMYVAFLVQHVGTLWWVGSWQANADPFLMIAGVVLCLFHPFFYFVPAECYYRFRRRFGLTPALIMLPFIWTAFEWLTSITEWAFPWLCIGYTQVNETSWVQIADLGGVLLVGFVIVAINSCLYYLATGLSTKRDEASKRNFIRQKNNIIVIAVLALLAIAPKIYSHIRLSEFDADNFANNPKLTIGIIQPNINPWDKWSRNPVKNISDHFKVQDSLSRATSRKIDLVLWSETSITFMGLPVNSYPYDLSILRPWLNTNDLSLMTGFTEFYFYKAGEDVPASAEAFPGDSSRRYSSFNSAIMVSPSRIRSDVQIYRKMKLTPISERIPYVDQIAWLKNILRWDVGISNWALGREQKNLQATGAKGTFAIAPIICIESIHQDFVRQFAKKGAEIFTVITNDAWYNHTFGPYQHLAIAQMRAIENKRYLARCANGGISAFISPAGEIIAQAEQYQNSGIARSIPKIKDLTFYSQIGDVVGWLALACVVIGGIMMRKK